MYRISTGITKTSMYGHYNAYAVYKLANGKYKVYRHTFTDSTLYDAYKNDWSAIRCEREALKLSRTDTNPVIVDDPPSFNMVSRAFH